MQIAAKPGYDPDTLTLESSVSIWMDGEGNALCPDGLDSSVGRQVWDTYHLVGDVLRSGDLALQPSSLFLARLSQAIDAEPPIVAPMRRRLSSVRLSLSGLAVAAAVASVAWVALPYFSGGNAGPAPGATAPSATATQVVATADDPGLRDYLDAHRQIAGISPVRQVSFDAGDQP